MWAIEPLYREGLPANWILYQIMCLVDANTFEPYVRNMGQLMMEKISNADLLISTAAMSSSAPSSAAATCGW